MQVLAREGNNKEFSPTRVRYLEDSLVVLGRYMASSRDRQIINILNNELQKKKEKLLHMNLITLEILTTYKMYYSDV